MALAFVIQVDFIDSRKKTSFTRIRVPTSFSIAALTTFAQDAGQSIVDITGCKVTAISVGLSFALTGLGAAAAAGADIASKAFIKVKSAVAGLFAKMSIPTIDEDAITITGTDEIDLANAGVATLVTLLQTGNGTVAPTDKYGNDLVSVDISVSQFMEHKG